MNKRGYTARRDHRRGHGRTARASARRSARRPRSRASTWPRQVYARDSPRSAPHAQAPARAQARRAAGQRRVTPGRTSAITQARARGLSRATSCSAGTTSTTPSGRPPASTAWASIWPTFSAPTLRLTSAGATFKQLFTKRYKHAPLIYQALHLGSAQRLEVGGRHRRLDRSRRRRAGAAAHRHAGHDGPDHALEPARARCTSTSGKASRSTSTRRPSRARPTPPRRCWRERSRGDRRAALGLCAPCRIARSGSTRRSRPTSPPPRRSRARRAPTSPIMGGGYAGLWTAIRIKQREPSCDVVVLEQDICGGGASGRNGGFALSWWAKLGTLVELCGATARSRSRTPAEAAVDEIGAFCDEHGIDAHYHRGGHLWTATSQAQLGAWDGVMADLPRARRDAVRGVDARADRPRAAARTATSPASSSPPPRSCSRRCWCAGSAASRSSSACASTRARASRGSTAARRRCCTRRSASLTADRVVIATNAWAVGLRELHTRLAIISSDIVATAPMPERLREIGWTRHECDQRLEAADLLLPHDRRRAHRLRQGRLGHRAATTASARASTATRSARATSTRTLPRDLPDARRRADRGRLVRPDRPHAHGHADLRPPRRPQPHRLRRRLLGQRRRARASWAARSSRRSRSASPTSGARARSSTAVQGRFPPEPVRFLGAHVVREGVRAQGGGRDARPHAQPRSPSRSRASRPRA